MARNGFEKIAEEEKQLIEHVEDIKRSTAFQRAEKDMLEGFISRQGPQEKPPQAPGDAAVNHQHEGVYQLLSLGQKIYVAQRELEETQREIEKATNHNKNHKAVMAKADLHLFEIRRQRFEFERDVVKPLAKNKGKMDAAKVLRYITDGIKRKEAQLENLCLNNKSKAKGTKHRLQFQPHKDIDEEQDEVHLATLKFDQDHHCEQTAKHSQELMRLKHLSVIAQKNLNSYKNKLQDETHESKELSNHITKRQEALAKIEEETRHVTKESAMEKALCDKLQSRLATFSAPDVMDYIQVKSRHKRLQHSFSVWERKVEISERALRSYTGAWKRKDADAASANNMESRGSKGNPLVGLRLPKIN